jgi:dienelactone hydrolase
MKRISVILLLLAGWYPTIVQAANPQTVTFPARDVSLRGVLFTPGTPGPYPAVVALHGCSGLYSKDGSLNPRHKDWGDRLAAAGFIVLMPDSYGSRDIGPQCKVRDRQVRPGRERVVDADDARAYLQKRPDVKAAAISLMGWSNGGSSVVQAVRVGADKPGAGPDFAKAVAFYPGCRLAEETGAWHARLPLLILIGGGDTWTPAAPCQALTDEARQHGEDVSIKVYPGAFHDFDHPNLRHHLREGLAYTGDGSGEAEVGTDPVARADALHTVPAFLAR